MNHMNYRKIILLVVTVSFIIVSVASGQQNTDMRFQQKKDIGPFPAPQIIHDIFSLDDFKEYRVMDQPIPIPEDATIPSDFFSINLDTPAAFSWRAVDGQDWTTRAKHQGNCGSCWLFAAMGALESMINIRENCSSLNPDLSEQYVLSCLPEAGSCNGGNIENCVYYYIMDTSAAGNFHNGVITDECFRYNSTFSYIPPCSEKPVNWQDFLVPIIDYNETWIDVTHPDLIQVIKTMIFEKGPVLSYFWVTERFQRWGALHKDRDEYYPDYNENTPHYVNHAITIVGWQDDPSIDNGGYWICKNTWGGNWGYEGFFNLEYNCLNMGAFLAWVDYDPQSVDWPPVAEASGFYQGSTDQAIEFDGSQSRDAEGDIVQYTWDFGDGTRTSGEKVNHIYTESGIYPVSLTVTDSSGMNDTTTTLAGVDTAPLDISITGGNRIDIHFENPVDVEMDDWTFQIEIKGLIIPDKIYKIYQSIPGNQRIHQSLSALGIGIALVDVSVENISESAYLLILGPFVKILSVW